MTKVAAVTERLARLQAICDSGFALAIHIRYTRPTILYRTYQQDWIDHYSERGFMLSDPVVHWGLTNIGAVNWADLTDQDPQGVIRDALAHGLHNGWTYATGPQASRTIAGLTKSGADFTPAQRAEVSQIVDTLHALTDGFETFSADIQAALLALSSS
ncbi:MAG: autoinducer binding domain-containing protein [Cypionkella sp.]|uniref:autoinducer binding domain-containing protein n=1 Tax=Cypionkella sp. TaxID=2811411 RepID=UPI002ABB79AE|nr:autoinducer binding domain-containing protein [Cypionkella sp.]MDZ4309402.1 autoinducer binding domain-containing protein [Cypionkella sp.]